MALIAVLLAACGAQATPSASSTGASNVPASDLPAAVGTRPAPSAPVMDVADLAGSMAAAEVAMRQEDREAAGLIDLGPGALQLAAAMDASAGRALTQARNDAAGPDGPTVGFMLILGDVVFDPNGGTKHIKRSKPVGPSSNKIDATMTAEVIKGS